MKNKLNAIRQDIHGVARSTPDILDKTDYSTETKVARLHLVSRCYKQIDYLIGSIEAIIYSPDQDVIDAIEESGTTLRALVEEAFDETM